MTSSIVHPDTPILGSVSRLRPLWEIFKEDWKLILLGSFFSLLLGSVLISGWPAGLWPDISVPYKYAGDGIFHAWMAERVSEGWIFDNARSGYPFGSNFYDFPGSDAGSHFLIKLFALFTGSSFAATNLFFLVGFPVCFSSAYVVARAFGLGRSFSVASALLFTFLPFHVLRIAHLFYTWYFVVPFFFYLAFSLYQGSTAFVYAETKRSFWTKSIALILGLLILSSFGVYYALFGVIVISLGGLLGWIKFKRSKVATQALLIVAILIGGVLINVAPNLVGKYQLGSNAEAAVRYRMEGELYGMKLMQLILPRADHRISWAGKFTEFYNATYPLVNENSMVVLGVVGSLGLLAAFFLLLSALAGKKLDPRLSFLVAVVFVLFMFGTIGGLGSLFSSFISSSIRAWNRISVFVGFGAIMIFFIALQGLISKKATRVKYCFSVTAIVLLMLGLYDQTVSPCKACIAAEKAEYESDRGFVGLIESALPPGAAVYQLPYIAFPEAPAVHNLYNYQLAAGFLHSKGLHWNFGGMKGRGGDLFYRSLAGETLSKQLEVIQRLGFNGIYIDRRGYADNAVVIIQRFTELLGAGPLLTSINGNLVFFKLNSPVRDDLVGLNASQIMEKAGYFADALGTRYAAKLEDGIDFTRPQWPNFVSGAKGFSGSEPWGRWSDRNLSHSARIDFTSPLPDKFTLVLVAHGFASNANKLTKVLVGNREYEITLPPTSSEIRLQVDLQGNTADSISFFPPNPVSPNQLGMSVDTRKLGVGFISLRFER